MTRKSTLIEWGHHLGVISDAQQGQDMTMAALEQGISRALVQRDRLVAGSDEFEDEGCGYTFQEGLVNNARVVVEEVGEIVQGLRQSFWQR